MTNRAQRTDADRAADAKRARRRRRRKKLGMREFPLELSEDICAQALIAAGWLPRRDAKEFEKVRDRLNQFVEAFLRGIVTRDAQKLRSKTALSENHDHDDSLGAAEEKPQCLVA